MNLYERMLRDFQDDPFEFRLRNQNGVAVLRSFAQRKGDERVLALVDKVFGIRRMRGETDNGSYKSSFDPMTGCIMREIEQETGFSRAMHSHGSELVRSPSPETVDISITDYCPMGCTYCYMDSRRDRDHAPVELVRKTIEGFDTPPYQMAIGGGEPVTHPEFTAILEMVRKAGTVPNYTTSGLRMTPEIADATNRYCGGVAMTYHAFRGVDWFRRHYQELREMLDVQLNVHVIADHDVDTNLGALLDAGLGPLTIVLLAYYPDVGRASMEGIMPRDVYDGTLPPLIKRALAEGHQIAFSEGMLPYFLSRPEMGVETTFATRSEGLYACYVNTKGEILSSSFEERVVRIRGECIEGGRMYHTWQEATVYTHRAQEIWDNMPKNWGIIKHGPTGGPCDGCNVDRCVSPHETHMHSCAYQFHNKR